MSNLIVLVIYALVGAIAISCTVNGFKQERYFLFGAWLMVAVESILYMAKTVFTG